MTRPPSTPLAGAVPTAQRWISDVATELGTADLDLAYRVCKAWFETVRDRLPIIEGAHLAAQLPEVMRGSYYESWRPTHVPVKYDADAFATRFARAAGICVDHAPDAARAVSRVLDRHMSADLREMIAQLPIELQPMLQPAMLVPAALPELVG